MEQLDRHRYQLSGVFDDESLKQIREDCSRLGLTPTCPRTRPSPSWLSTVYCSPASDRRHEEDFRPRIRFYLRGRPSFLLLRDEGVVTLSRHAERRQSRRLRLLEVSREKHTMTLDDLLEGRLFPRRLIPLGGITCRREIFESPWGRVTIDTCREYSCLQREHDRLVLTPVLQGALSRVEYKFIEGAPLDQRLEAFFRELSQDSRTNFEILQSVL